MATIGLPKPVLNSKKARPDATQGIQLVPEKHSFAAPGGLWQKMFF